MSQAVKSGNSKVRRSLKKDNTNLFKDGFNWDKYLQICNLPAAPIECFMQYQTDKLVNNFKLQYKLEAQDPRNPTSICLATVVALQGPRILIRLDGGDDCNDFWRLVDSEDIYPLGTHEGKGSLLQPPLGFTKNMSTWSSFLAKTREKGIQAGTECFLPKPMPPENNLFEIGMKLEAVDRKNPHLICPATVGDTKLEQVFISFDGWRGAMDYWSYFTSRDLFPAGWCKENDHPLSNPGTKGDNPAVVDKLKILAENAKRKTRSVAQNVSETEKNASKTFTTPLTLTIPSKYETLSHIKASRSRQRMRLARSNNSLLKPQNTVEKVQSENFTQPRAPQSHGLLSTTESGDSSVSSEDMSDSSEETQDDGDAAEEKFDSGEDSEIDESVVEVKKPSVIPMTDKEQRERRISNNRKRYASGGGDDEFNDPIEKSSKSIRKHSLSLHENSRMVGFGNSNPGSHENANSNIQSPSFTKNIDSPTSLFGLNRDEIVKKATEGWPSRLMTTKSVVTSDNKLARFGSQNVADSSMQDEEENVKAVDVTMTKPPSENEERKTPDSTSTTSEKISSHTVSSTTNPVQEGAENEEESELSRSSNSSTHLGQIPLPSDHLLPRSNSRNPERWTVGDVIDYVRDNEPALTSMIHLFQLHEIDGPALLLINSSIAVKYMSMKLGPALKLANLVERVKKVVPTPRNYH